MPNIDKFRRGLTVKGPALFAGSVSIAGPFPINSTMTFSSAPKFNVPPAFATGSAAYQPSGVLRINSGATSATASTTAINSGGFPMLQPIVLGVGVASFYLIGQIVVTTVAQAASGGYFSVGYTGTQNGLAMNVDVGWFIVNPA